ncbi:MAG: hypothetical protein IJA44_03030 [Clostridia bacterium]|nr:hypothetical protein [Clostridia bacterium]
MQIIGIDIGTTSICGVAIDAQSGELLKSITLNSNAFIKSDKPFEKIQSPQKTISLALEILDNLITDHTAAIGVTGQMHGIVYTDQIGNAVSPLYTWQDKRGDEAFGNTTYAKHLKSFAGYGCVTDFYNQQNNLVPQNAVSFCTITDYLVMKLCSLNEPVMHSTNAASLGLYDIKKNRFTNGFTPQIATDYQIVGEYKNIPVSVAVGDNQASVFSTLKNQGDLLINVGTGSQASIICDHIITGENLEVRPYFENKYLIVGAALCGGRAYSMLKDFYKSILCKNGDIADDKIYKLMDEMLEKASPTLLVDTRFAGTRKDPEICGSINGITTESFTPEALTKGVLCGMCNELYNMFLEMETPINGIVGSGNGIRKNKYFIKLCEKKFKTEMKIPAHLEEAAVGAAMFGGISAKIYENSGKAQEIIKYR